MSRRLALLPLAPTALAFAAAATAGTAAAEGPKVAASIKPVHSLVAGVMAGVGEPGLIIEGAGSPHTYQMRPSEARMLNDADVVFYVGEALETFLDKPLGTLSGDARVAALMEVEGVELLPYRESGTFEAHAHAADGEEHEHGEEETGHTAEHGHEHGEEMAEAEDHGHDHDGGMDGHIWLDPDNARAMADAIAAELAEADPANAATYRENAERLSARLDELDAELEAKLAPVRDVPFVVFHDAYQYFDRHYDLRNVGSITVSPERQPGAQRLTEIREEIAKVGAACVFSEPQFEPRLVATVIEGTDARAATLDPLGAEIPAGPEAYFELMRNLAAALEDCLLAAS